MGRAPITRRLWLVGLCIGSLALGVALSAAAQQDRREWIQERDENGDGKLQRDELPIEMLKDFDRFDLNHDAAIDSFEIYDFEQRRLRTFEERPTRPAPAGAREQGQPAPDGRAARPVRKITTAEELVEVLDRNGDGFVSLNEAPRSRHDLLLRMDTDGDRRVSVDEARAVDRGGLGARPPSGPRGRTMKRTVTLMDTDGDGKLQYKEAPLAVQRSFESHDLDGDGAIDGREAAAADAAER